MNEATTHEPEAPVKKLKVNDRLVLYHGGLGTEPDVERNSRCDSVDAAREFISAQCLRILNEMEDLKPGREEMGTYFVVRVEQVVKPVGHVSHDVSLG